MDFSRALAVGVPAVFFICMLVVTLPMIVNESGSRKIVGIEVDSGSQIFGLAGGTISVIAAITAVAGALAFTAFKLLGSSDAWTEFWKRFTA